MTAKIMKELYEARERIFQVLRFEPGEDSEKLAYQKGFYQGINAAIDIINKEMSKNENNKR